MPRRANEITRITCSILYIYTALILLCGCTTGMRHAQHDGDNGQIGVRFVYIDARATTVCVSGSFNGWSDQSHCLSKSSDTWTAAFMLPPGRYEYQFVVDGTIRRVDPRNVLSEDNGFGMTNSVLVVE